MNENQIHFNELSVDDEVYLDGCWTVTMIENNGIWLRYKATGFSWFMSDKEFNQAGFQRYQGESLTNIKVLKND